MTLLGPEPNTKKAAEFILGLVGKTYAHQLQPFFRGIITTVAAQPAPQVGYLVRIQRPEATTPDGVDYLCVIPGYVPAIGDVVDLMWRDDRVGYVVAVLSLVYGALFNARAYRSANVALANGLSSIVFNTKSPAPQGYDPNGNFNTATGTYTAPVAGMYAISFAVRIHMINTITAFGLMDGHILVGGAIRSSFAGFPVINTLDAVVLGSDIQQLAASDSVTIEINNQTGVAQQTGVVNAVGSDVFVAIHLLSRV